MNCQHCQSLLFDHLYGLLEANEEAAVDAHLSGCPTCTAQRATMARWQGLIATAAKSAFPHITFAPPTVPEPSLTTTPARSAPAGLPQTVGGLRARTRRVAAMIPWAVAATILLAIPGTVLPVVNLVRQFQQALQDVEFAQRETDDLHRAAQESQSQWEQTLHEAEFKLTTAQQTQHAILDRWVKEQKAAVETVTARRLSVDVFKPATVQPGAPNDFVVVVNDRRDAWESARKSLVAEIHAVDTTDAVIYAQPLNLERTGERRHTVRLPASAWTKVKPETELYLVVAQVDEETQTRTIEERVPLAGPVYTTLLVTDKAIYRPGERLFFRSLTLDRITFQTPPREQILKYELLAPNHQPIPGLQLTGTTDLLRVDNAGRVEPVRLPNGQPVRGVGCGEFILPVDLPEGDYTLQLTELQHPGGFPATIPVPVTRTIKVRSGLPDTYRKRILFHRESYAPGDVVEAIAQLQRHEQPMAGVAIEACRVEVDGQQLSDVQIAPHTDAQGQAKIHFQLPAAVPHGDVRVMVSFRTPEGDPPVTERVPVIGNRVLIEFFPECGDTLIAGVETKIYVRATTPAGFPVNFRGIITDGRRTLAHVTSFNDPDQPGSRRGLAAFTFTPQLGQRVWLKLESPASIYAPIMVNAPVPHAAVAMLGGPAAVARNSGFPLPEAQPEGLAMAVLDPVTAPGQPIRVRLTSVGQARQIVIGAYTRGKLSDTQRVLVEREQPQVVKLMANRDPRGGVVRITAFEERDDRRDLQPVAERLVYRKPGEWLKLAFTATSSATVVQAPAENSRQAFDPHTPLSLAISATDEKGQPTVAVLWAAAVNAGVTPGPKDRLLPTHFLLAGEVKSPDELEYADFLLSDHPSAAEALDLLLGTQGWRRFVEQSFPAGRGGKPLQPLAHPDVVEWLVHNGQYATRSEPAAVRKHRELYQKYAPLYEAATKAVITAQEQLAAARQTLPARPDEALKAAEQRLAQKQADVAAAQIPVQQFQARAWWGMAGFAALALMCGCAGFWRPTARLPWGFSSLGAIGLSVFLFVALQWVQSEMATAHDLGQRLSASNSHEPELAPPPRAAQTKLHHAVGVDTDRQPSHNQTYEKGSKHDTSATTDSGHHPSVPPTSVIGPQPPLRSGPRPGADASQLPRFGTGDSAGFVGQNPATMAAYPPPPGAALTAPLPVAPPRVTMPNPKSLGSAAVMPDRNTLESRKDALRASTLQQVPHAAIQIHERSLREAQALATQQATARNYALTAPIEGYLTPDLPASTPERADTTHRRDLERYAVEKVRGSVQAPPSLVVREYAAARPTPETLPQHTEAADTILWQPIIVVPGNGHATLQFHLGEAPSGYELIIAGHTPDGRLGAIRDLLPITRLPRSASPKAEFEPHGPIAPKEGITPPATIVPPLPPMP
ncbi:MAG: zf-HC2 domain-containing protein [Gemmataceae bacterium]|nr:zf-HC2 domain-containing protein [Gemmata sp.]MDW8199365.1 zf-HC2 domain-containing protein [Gemmataceae bacterium]